MTSEETTSTPPTQLFREFAAASAGSPEHHKLRDALVAQYSSLAHQLAHRFAHRGEQLDDLAQVAMVGLIHAIDRFDATRGVEFPSYAVPTIVGEIKRYFRDHAWSMRVPRRLKELHLSLTAAINELSQRNGHAPNASDLAEYLGISREEVLEGLEVAGAYRSGSLDAPMRGEESMPTVASTLGVEDPNFDQIENRETLLPLLAALPPRERTIVMLRFFGNLTQSQIAEKVGLSQMHVSRLLAQTLRQLRTRLINGQAEKTSI